MKVLIVIANFGTNQVDCIKKCIEEYKSWPWEIDIVINSNIPLNIDGVKDNVLTLKSTLLYPRSTWKTIYENKGKYDLYIALEADIFITYENIKFWLESTKTLPVDIYSKFMRYEIDESSNLPSPMNRQYNDMHHMNDTWKWNYDSPFIHEGITYAECNNWNQACLVFNNNHLDFLSSKIDMNDLDWYNPSINFPWDSIERWNFDIFYYFRKNVTSISHFDKILVHHMQNRYAKIPPSDPNYWMRGIDEETMQDHIKLLKFYAQHWKITEDFLNENPGYALEGINHNGGIK